MFSFPGGLVNTYRHRGDSKGVQWSEARYYRHWMVTNMPYLLNETFTTFKCLKNNDYNTQEVLLIHNTVLDMYYGVIKNK